MALKRGTTGIALIDPSNDNQKIKSIKSEYGHGGVSHDYLDGEQFCGSLWDNRHTVYDGVKFY